MDILLDPHLLLLTQIMSCDFLIILADELLPF